MDSVAPEIVVEDGGILQATPDLKIFESFESMELDDKILRGIFAHGFERPSDIQTKAIVPMKEGHDILAQARSGTGKTATFCIGAMTRVNPAVKKMQVLVLTPSMI